MSFHVFYLFPFALDSITAFQKTLFDACGGPRLCVHGLQGTGPHARQADHHAQQAGSTTRSDNNLCMHFPGDENTE